MISVIDTAAAAFCVVNTQYLDFFDYDDMTEFG